MEVVSAVPPMKRLTSGLAPVWLILAIVVIFSSTINQLFARWVQWDESVAHGLPVAFIFLFLLFQRSGEFTTSNRRRWDRVPAFILLVLSSMLWVVSHQVGIAILEQLCILALVMTSVWLVFGWSTLWQHRLLLLFPLFAIPVWDYLNDPLLHLSSVVVGEWVRWAKMPAIIQGNSIIIPYGHILIADGCSGLRYFIVSMALGFLIALLNRYTERKLLAVLLVAAALGLVTNWVRIFILIVIGYQTQMQSSLMHDHEMFGWLLFGTICLPAIYFAPVVKSKSSKNSSSGASGAGTPFLIPLFFLALAGMVVGPILSVSLTDTAKAENTLKPTLGAGWVHRSPEAMPVELNLPAASLTELGRSSVGLVFVRRDHYQRTANGEQLVPYVGRIFDDSVWMEYAINSENLLGHPVRWSQFRNKHTGTATLQVQWFTLGDKVTSSVRSAKLWQIPALLRGITTFTITTLQMECAYSACEQETMQLRQYATEQVQESVLQ